MREKINLYRRSLNRSNHDRSPLIDALLFDVSRATDAATLLTYRNDTLSDHCLDPVEKEEIYRAIDQRFAFLNAIATP